jgi:subtilisin family serine protease
MTNPARGGIWSLEVRHRSGQPGEFHVWLLLPGNVAPNAAEFSGANLHFSQLIGSPGSSSQTVTVAAFTSRNQWTDSTGTSRSVGLAPNTIADFCSPGPRRDAGLKPDVAAPGAMIVSCLSSASVGGTSPSQIVAPGFRVNAGTSMAAPFITGVIALRLQKKPGLTPAEAKAWLQTRSRVPGQPGGTHNAKWGYGLLKL